MASQHVTVNAQPSLPPPYETLTNTQDVEDVSPVVPNQRFKVAIAKITGRLQIACAVVSVAIGLASVITAVSCGDKYNQFPAIVGWPIWGGICFYLVAGILGINTRQGRTCMIVAYMGMSILAATSAAGQICMESIGAAINSVCYYYDYCCSYTLQTALYAMAAVIAFVEMVVAIVAAAFCCHGVCCHPTKIIIVQYSNQPNPQAQVFHQPPNTQFQSNPQPQVFHQPPVINFQPNREAPGQGPYQEFNAPPRAAITSTTATAPPQYEKLD